MGYYSLKHGKEIFDNLSEDSLLRHYSNMYSECGQDGILNFIFNKIGIERGFFVDFGAWDGLHLSNTRSLLMRGWSGVSIECSSERYQELKMNSPCLLTAVNAMVGTSDGRVPGKSLRKILDENNINAEEVTFLSIDIDGSDLEVFEDLDFSPPVILLEGGFNYNPTVTNKVDFSYASGDKQHPLGAVQSSIEKRGYKMVCFFQDSYLVRGDLALPFKEQIKLGASGLYKDAWIFASEDLRNYLLELRNNDQYIQNIERECLGYFDNNPISNL